MSDFSSKMKELLKKGKGKGIILLAVAGIVLIILSEIIPENEENGHDTETEPVEWKQYCEETEERLYELLSAIDGVGKLHVMVSVRSTASFVYETDRKTALSTKDDSDGSVERNESADVSVATYEDSGGKNKALVNSVNMPQISGVTVVCEGGGDVKTEQTVTSAVSTVLGISPSRVFVARYGKTD